MSRGFILIELTLLAFFGGALAAVAIPGFMQYVKQSKASEAKTNLKNIANGALAFYESEHAADDSGALAYSKVYPHCGVKVNGNALEFTECKSGQNPIGKPASADTVGIKFDPNDYSAAFAASPWKDMHFAINKPFYYYYDYVSATGNAEISRFKAKASASLNLECDSIFFIQGLPDGELLPIIDGSGMETCNTATLD